MKWLKRSPKAVDVQVRMLTNDLMVRHTMQKLPEPIPVRGYFRIYDNSGRYWTTAPVPINGKQMMKQFIPMAWITGNEADISKQVGIEFFLEY